MKGLIIVLVVAFLIGVIRNGFLQPLMGMTVCLIFFGIIYLSMWLFGFDGGEDVEYAMPSKLGEWMRYVAKNNAMQPSDPQKNYLEFKERFFGMTNDQLIETYNNDVGKPGWVSSRGAFSLALHEEFEKRKIKKPMNWNTPTDLKRIQILSNPDKREKNQGKMIEGKKEELQNAIVEALREEASLLEDQAMEDKTIRHKRGVFLLITKRPSGHENYISFKYKDSSPTFFPDFQLAMFNQLLFANEYLTNLKKVVKEGTPSDLPPDGPFFIQQITTQKGWDFARQKVLDDPLTKSGVLNPCDGDGDHRCIIMPINLDEYADFEKLKEVFAGLPDTHYNLV